MPNFKLSALAFVALAASLPGQTIPPQVRFHTNLGDIDVTLTPDAAPLTVANFLSYMNKGSYSNSIFHRSVPGFIIQAGGFQLINHSVVTTAQDAAVKNEFNVTNSRGTIAMAKLGTDPNSATNQWFFNLANNGSNLDNQNGGFTVFGKIVNAAGLSVIDRIAGLPVVNIDGSTFAATPLTNYKSGTIQDANWVQVSSIVTIPNTIAAAFQDAASFTGTSTTGVAPGQIMAIYGTYVGPSNLTVATPDSTGALPTSLAGTRVLFNNNPAPILFTSSGQINVVAPYGIADLSTVAIVIEYQGIRTGTISMPVAPANPALFTFNSGKGDAAIQRFPDYSTITAANPASSGDILILYGEGQGAMAPVLPDGAILSSTLPTPVVKPLLLIDGKQVPTSYAGAAPGLVNGALQINFTVPQLASGPHQIQIQVGDRVSPTGVNLQIK